MPSRLGVVLSFMVASVGWAAPRGNGFVPSGVAADFCPRVPGLEPARDVVVPVDGGHAYALSTGFGPAEDRVTVWSRDATGALTYVAAFDPGVTSHLVKLAPSPEGTHIYGVFAEGVVVLARDVTTGQLSVVETVLDGAAGVNGLGVPTHLAVSPDGAHLYVSGREDTATVVAFARDAVSGRLTLAQVVRGGVGGLAPLGRAIALAVSPDGNDVYVGGDDQAFSGSAPTNGEHAVIMRLRRDAVSGRLSASGVERPSAGIVAHLTLSPDSRFVYADMRTLFPFETRHATAVFARDATTGALSLRAVQQIIGAMLLFHGNDDAYSALPVGWLVYQWSRDTATGLLSPVRELRMPSSSDGTTGLAMSADGVALYLATGSLTVLRRQPTDGALAYLQRFRERDPVVGDVTLSPDGRHAYATCREGEELFTLDRDAASGQLTPAGSIRQGRNGVEGLRAPRELTMTADGRHLYVVADHGDGQCAVAGFARDDATGTLQETQTLRFDGDFSSSCRTLLTASADGSRLFLADHAAVRILTRDTATGLLSISTVHPGGNGSVGDVVASPDGFLYVADDSGAIDVYATGGSLTLVAHQTVARGEYTRSILALALSPDATHLHAAEYRTALHVLTRDPSSGVLTALESLPYGREGNILGEITTLAMTPDGANLLGGDSGRAVAVLRRAPDTGQVSFADRAMINEPSRTLGPVHRVASAPDGRHVYAAFANGVTVLAASQACDPTRRINCRRSTASGRSLLRFVDHDRDASNQLAWKMHRAEAASLAELGDLGTTTGVAMCLYDAASSLLMTAEARAGEMCGTKPCWAGSPSGWRYAISGLTRPPDGVARLVLKAGVAGKASFTLRGKGGAMSLPTLPLPLPLTAQLQSTNGDCWEATFTSAVQATGRFVATAP